MAPFSHSVPSDSPESDSAATAAAPAKPPSSSSPRAAVAATLAASKWSKRLSRKSAERDPLFTSPKFMSLINDKGRIELDR